VSYHYDQQWCSRRDCPCGIPGNPCSNWEGFDKRHKGVYQGRYVKGDKETWPFRYCLHCGWEKQDHKPLIHKGGKP
jgi:hypothetical protein